MHFEDQTLTRLVQDVGYMRFMSRPAGMRNLHQLVMDASELQHIFSLYPHVKYAPLETHYLLLKYLAVLDTRVVEDLTTQLTWRGSVVAAFLACLQPKADYLVHFQREIVSAHPHNRWILQMAIDATSAALPVSDPKAFALVTRLREFLMCVELPKWSLPSAPSAEQMATMGLERESIRSAYHSQGLEAALALRKHTAFARFDAARSA